MTAPLAGIKVIEIGQAFAGPLAGAILGDMGADVIKVEKPEAHPVFRGVVAPSSDQRPDERAEQLLASFSCIVNELEEAEVDWQLLLRNAPVRT